MLKKFENVAKVEKCWESLKSQNILKNVGKVETYTKPFV